MGKQFVKRYGTPVSGTTNRVKALSQVSLNANEVLRTSVFNVYGLERLVIGVALTARASATTIVITPYFSLDGGTTYIQLDSTSVDAGVGTDSEFSESHTLAGETDSLGTAYDVRGYDYFKVIVSGAGAGAGDLFDLYASAAGGLKA